MQFEYSSTPPNVYPFTALAIIGNQNGLAETFDMKVLWLFYNNPQVLNFC